MKELTEKEKKELAYLKANQEMLERSQRECLERGQYQSAELISQASEEVKMQGMLAGYTQDQIKGSKYTEPNPQLVEEQRRRQEKSKEHNHTVSKATSASENMNVNGFKTFRPMESNNNIKPQPQAAPTPVSPYPTPEQISTDYGVDMKTINAVSENEGIPYEIIPLPSNGECYPSHKTKVAVAYLTAEDENIITSPHLYRDGMIMDVLLQRKVLDKDIDVNSLCKGDRDAVILWLRATSYGVDLPITVRDPETGKEFSTTIDLTTIKSKPFNLKSDEEGLFEYICPHTNDRIKFKFFTREDERKMQELERMDSRTQTRMLIEKDVRDLRGELKNADYLRDDEKQIVEDSIRNLETWSSRIGELSGPQPYNRSVTFGMMLSVVEYNGNRERAYVEDRVRKMPAYDALAFRRYVSANEPAMDFNITVQRPESLGGGSFDTFLQLDATLFLNIA